jgi:hypothetical protein
VSSIISGNTASTNPTVTWACVAFVIQALTIGGPIILRAGALETRVSHVETSVTESRARLADGDTKYTAIIDRLARIETSQQEILIELRRR